MKVEVCDLCKKNEPNKKFKVKMSSRGHMERTGYGMRWNSRIWNPYEKISICEDCAEKLFGIKSSNTRTKEIVELLTKGRVNE